MNRRRLLSLICLFFLTAALILELNAMPDVPLPGIANHAPEDIETYGNEELDASRQKLPYDWRIVRAALRNITKVENFCPGMDPYKVLFGCEEFTPSTGDHPRIHKPYRNTTTTAYGFYQVIDKTWDLTNQYCDGQLTDIRQPEIQDLFGICNTFRVGAMQHMLAGQIYNPVDDSVTVDESQYKRFLCKAGREWAGSPFSPYGQIEGVNANKWKPENFNCDSDADWARYNANPSSFTSPALYKEFWDDFNTELAIENKLYLDEFFPSQNAFVFPLKGKTWQTATVGDAFGIVTASRNYKPHAGQDFPEEKGYPIVASEGMVIGLTYEDPNKVACGKGVFATGADGRSWLYCHMSDVLVSKGEVVEPGQEIGRVGDTGHSTSYHLHVELREDGVNVDPSSILQEAVAA